MDNGRPTRGYARVIVVVLAVILGTSLSAVPSLKTPSTVHAEPGLPVGTHDGWQGEVGPAECGAYGWAVDPDNRYTDLTVRILSDDVPVAEGVANLFRQDLVDAGVSPDGFSGFDIKLWGLISLNSKHVIRAQARDAQTAEWVDLGETPKELTCQATVPDPNEIKNPRMSYFTAECQNRGILDVTAVVALYPFGQFPSTFQVLGENQVLVNWAPGIAKLANDYCAFGWTGGWEPIAPWNRFFATPVLVAPISGP